MNHEKKLYEKPQMSVIIFESADIITTSGFHGEDDPLYGEA